MGLTETADGRHLAQRQASGLRSDRPLLPSCSLQEPLHSSIHSIGSEMAHGPSSSKQENPRTWGGALILSSGTGVGAI